MDAISNYKRMSDNSSLVTNVSNDMPPEIIIKPKRQNGGCKKGLVVLLSIICAILLLASTLYFLHQQGKDRFEGEKFDNDQMRRSTLDAMESFLKMYNDNDEIGKDIIEATETFNTNNAKSPHIDEIDADYDFENQNLDWFLFWEAPSVADYQQIQEYMAQSDSYEENTTDSDELDTAIFAY